ncbi:unnamed protein product [Paramecium octaurelia]|uniref:Uncharacterized protein n=1 Tax=Paramecium octaurelia TaxID=43137 RepID=A0A8S1T1D3_PAROT|nr:unnamed protein product [Paramecium octaurelia]
MILGLNGQNKGKSNPKHRDIIKKAIVNLDGKQEKGEQQSVRKDNNNVEPKKTEKKQKKTTQTKKKSQKKSELPKSKKIRKQ